MEWNLRKMVSFWFRMSHLISNSLTFTLVTYLGLEPVIERPSENGTSHEHPTSAVSAPLTNGNHEHENQPDSLHSSAGTPKTPPTHKEESEEVKETTTTKRPVSSGRSRSGSSRPITGYGKTRTSTSDETAGENGT